MDLGDAERGVGRADGRQDGPARAGQPVTKTREHLRKRGTVDGGEHLEGHLMCLQLTCNKKYHRCTVPSSPFLPLHATGVPTFPARDRGLGALRRHTGAGDHG